MNLASSLALHSSTSLPEALSLPQSTVQRFLEGTPFKGYRREREADLKVQVAVVNRLNDVIRACGVIAKTIAKARSG